jgi:hypothetical protein
VRGLQRSGVPLAIEHMLTHPHEPLWTALTAPWPWAGVGVATFILNERLSTGRRSGFVQLMQRSNRPEADLLHIAPALHVSGEGEYRQGETWNRLLDHCTVAAASHGVQRLYASTPAGSVEQDYLKQVGFCRYAHETIFRLASAPPPGGALVGFRPQRPQDSWALQRLYLRTTPRLVQQSEGTARHNGVTGGPLFSWWEPADWQGVIWEPAGEMRGAAQVHVGRRGHWLRIWGANELSGRELRALVEQGLGLIRKPQTHSWRRGLNGLRRGDPTRFNMPVYVSVRDYEFGLTSALTGFGFSPYMDRARFVKHTVALVREPILMPAATRELRREVALPGGRFPAQR